MFKDTKRWSPLALRKQMAIGTFLLPSEFLAWETKSPEYVEYISNPGHYDFTIKNYYDAPRIYTITDPKTQSTWVDIGRNATHTQTKQEDIIKYIVKYE